MINIEHIEKTLNDLLESYGYGKKMVLIESSGAKIELSANLERERMLQGFDDINNSWDIRSMNKMIRRQNTVTEFVKIPKGTGMIRRRGNNTGYRRERFYRR